MVAQHEAEVRETSAGDRGEARITVTQLPDTIFGNVIEAYSHHSFERGYQVAVTEIIASLLPATEAFLREHGCSSEHREALYRFERFLARRFDTTVRSDHWVENGGGI